MSYQILSLKWRPKKFSDIVGQKHISQALANAIKLDRVAHAFTFSGPRGVGKTSTARILSQELNDVKNLSQSIDIIEMDAASNRGIDEIRNLRESAQYAPSSGKYKIYIIDEAHMLTKEAFNALLKTLEEPPSHVVFILATTELYKMPETIVSRTQRYDFKRLTVDEMYSQMKHILKHEDINSDDESLYKIAEKADGSMRDALSILDQIICVCGNKINIDTVMSTLGIIDESSFFSILLLVGQRKSGDMFDIFNEIILSGVSIDNFIEGFIKFVNTFILSNATNHKKYQSFKDNYNLDKIDFSELDLLRLLDVLIKFQLSLKQIQQPRIATENLLLKLSYFDNSIDVSFFLNNVSSNTSFINKEVKLDKEVGYAKSKKVVANKIKSSNDIKFKNVNNKDTVDKNPVSIDSNKIAVNSKTNNDFKLTVDEFYNNWDNILSLINKVNIIHSLEKIKIEKFNKDKIIIKILDINEFIFKNITKELDLINSKINEYFNIKIKLELKYLQTDTKEEKISVNKVVQDKDNPLFMDALNKFRGEIIK